MRGLFTCSVVLSVVLVPGGCFPGSCGPESGTHDHSGNSDGPTSCLDVIDSSIMPPLDCTPPEAGSNSYDGCTHNTPCGPVYGCPLERPGQVQSSIQTVYTPPDPSFVPPTTLLPPMGASMDARATGWFTRGDGTLNTGSCAFAPVQSLYGVALSSRNFGNADWCGACAEVVGTSGKRVRVQIVDQCSGCHDQSLDIPSGPETPFSVIRDADFHNAYQCPGYDGSEPISWHIVPCEAVGGIRISYLVGYNKWTPAVRILNHRLPIVRLEEQVDNVWTTINRTQDNKYVLQSRTTNTTIPVILRITAMDGATITGTFPTFEPEKIYECTSQF